MDGHAEFTYWCDRVARWLDDHHPGTGAAAEWSSLPEPQLVLGGQYYDDPESWSVFRRAVRTRLTWRARLATNRSRREAVAARPAPLPTPRVFIVHGHDEGLLSDVTAFLEELHLEPIVLHQQPDRGRTIIEKFTDHADVSFAVVLLTPDDIGGLKGSSVQVFKTRARQNVIQELGYFLGRIGRDRVCALYHEGVDIPSDYQGVLFVPLSGDWPRPTRTRTGRSRTSGTGNPSGRGLVAHRRSPTR